MMDYEVFREVVSERIKDFLPPIFSSYKVKINTVRKVNEEKEALIMMPEKSGELTAMPNIYLDEMYEEFQKVEDLDVVLRLIAAMVIHYTGRFKPSEVDLDFKQKKDAIVMNLINTEKNRALLEHVPHKDVLDLSIVYRIIMAREDNGMATVLITYEMLKDMGMSQEELEQIAYINTGKMFPVEIFKLSEFLYVMTNEAKVHGATTMMYKDAVKALAEKIGGDFYLIPSSIHEVMAIPEGTLDPKKLILMLEEGNRTCCAENEILSNTIYHYSVKKDCFSMAASYCTKEEMDI